MDISVHLSTCSGVWRGAPPASAASVERLVASSPVRLPSDYLAFLAVSDGGEGDLGVEPGWIVFWSSEKVIELNSSYAVAEFAPGLLGLGSNGGGELIALDTSAGAPYPVVSVPFVPMAREEARPICESFAALVPLVGVDAGAV